jgi:nucleoside-diphosphate-sugar epimerase
LVKEGHAVRVFDNYSRGGVRRLEDIASSLEFVEADVCDPAPVREATAGMDVLVHLAAVNGTRNFYEHPDRVLEVGIKGAINTLEAALHHGVKRYVVASSAEVYQQPSSVPTPETERLIVPDVHNPRYSYGGSKMATELLTLHFGLKRGLDAVIFRPHNVYGPDMGGEHVIPQFVIRMKRLTGNGARRRIEFPIMDSGEETRAFCFIDDAVEAILLCIRKGQRGQIYHVGNDREEISIRDLAFRIARVLDLEIDVLPGKEIPGQTRRRVPSIQKIEALGYQPTVRLEDGLRVTADWYWKQDLSAYREWSEYLRESGESTASG